MLAGLPDRTLTAVAGVAEEQTAKGRRPVVRLISPIGETDCRFKHKVSQRRRDSWPKLAGGATRRLTTHSGRMRIGPFKHQQLQPSDLGTQKFFLPNGPVLERGSRRTWSLPAGAQGAARTTFPQ